MTDDEINLRDRFAGQAMQALVLGNEVLSMVKNLSARSGSRFDDPDDAVCHSFHIDFDETPPATLSEVAYQYADAMLRARKAADVGAP